MLFGRKPKIGGQKTLGEIGSPESAVALVDLIHEINFTNIRLIGVFLRPYLCEMLSRLQPYFDLCIYTASE